MSLRAIKARSLGRLELLAWVNEFLEMDYSKIEHLADGIAFCQIFDACYTPVRRVRCGVHYRDAVSADSHSRTLPA